MIDGLRVATGVWLVAWLGIVGLAWWRRRRFRQAALGFSAVALLRPGVQAGRRGPDRRLAVFRLAALALLVLALARPQIERAENREDARGINLMLALDFSGTMRTRDLLLDGRRATRSEVLKRLTAEFIRARPQDRIGLVCFDRDAYVASPLTLDHDWVLDRLTYETNGIGTDVGSSLAVAAQHLQRHTNETRVIILMTDAENISAGPEPDAVAEALRPLGIRVHCAQILSPDANSFRSDLSDLLTHTAVRTGGGFFRIRAGADLRAVYREIDRLEKKKLTDRRQKTWRELFPWLAVPVLGLVLAEQVLGYTRWRRLP